MKNRVGVYFDGFNLYRGMCDAKYRSLLWLDLRGLAEGLCADGSQLVSAKYFTARKLNLKDPGTVEHASEEKSRKRQSEYIEAVAAKGVEVFEGKFKRRHVFCRACKTKWQKPEEKMTDVHVATQLLSDAFRGKIDSAIVVSGDADIGPPIRVLVEELECDVVVAFPPKRTLNELKQIATSVIHINKHHLAKHQLPDTFIYKGHTFQRPDSWR